MVREVIVISFISQWMKRSKHGFLVFPPKKTLICKRHCSISQSCCSITVKAKYRLISRKFFGHEVFIPERSLNQPKATRVCIRSTNQSNRSISVRLLFLFVRAFSLLQGISRQQTIFLIHLRFLVPWFHGSIVICDCSAVQSAVCLAAAPVFLLGATRHFVLLSCKICAEIVVYRMLAVFLNGLNGKNSSRRIVRNIFSVYFFKFGFQD